MSGYTKFENYGKFNRCTLRGDNRVMNPLMLGLETVNPFRIPNNGMRVLPPVKTAELDYGRLANAYPQAKV